MQRWFLVPVLVAICVPGGARADDGDGVKQVVIVEGGVVLPPPVIVDAQVAVQPPPTVIVQPVPPPPPPVPQPVYAPPQPVYLVEAPEPAESPYDVVLTLNPLLFWFGNFQLEFTLGNLMSFVGQLDFMYFSLSDEALWLAGALVGLNFYVGQRAPEGFWLGPRAGYDQLGFTETDDQIGIIRVGGFLGYQWIWDSSFALNLGGGFMYTAVGYESGSSDSFIAGMFLPTLDVKLGFGI